MPPVDLVAAQAKRFAASYPALEGEGRSRVARAGWGDLSARALCRAERPSPHPVSSFAALNMSRPTSELRSSRTLQGRVRKKPSLQGQKFHPVRLLAGGVGFQLVECAAGLVDGVDGHAVGQLADRGEVAAGRIDVEATRLFLGRDRKST